MDLEIKNVAELAALYKGMAENVAHNRDNATSERERREYEIAYSCYKTAQLFAQKLADKSIE